MFKAVFEYGDTYSEYAGTAEYLVELAMVHETYYASVLDALVETGYAEWGWWSFWRS